jgi:hypothetical protein
LESIPRLLYIVIVIFSLVTMASASVAQPDMSLIGELMESIDREPPAIGARKLLVEHYIAVGWIEAAQESIQDLVRISPTDEDVKEWSKVFLKTEVPALASCSKAPSHKQRKQHSLSGKSTVKPATLPSDPDQRAAVKKDLLSGLKSLRLRARNLVKDTRLLANLQPHTDSKLQSTNNIDDLQALAEGRITTVLGRKLPEAPTETATDGKPAKPGAAQPQSVRAVARDMKASPDSALETAVTDFSNIVGWQRSLTTQATPPEDDAIRETLAKRVRALKAALPDELQNHPSAALMHVEHELLNRKYVNDETMLGDSIAEIPRESFFMSEDGYAWDMDELAQAITANAGIMRNPLSKLMFSPDDIRFIVQHPKGKSLAAMQIEQDKLSKGVRPKTLVEMDKLAKVLLEDQSADQIPTRHAVDEFYAYLATLPESEQKALDKLRVPAKDSHTGAAYDASIGESLKDALGNRTCKYSVRRFGVKTQC